MTSRLVRGLQGCLQELVATRGSCQLKWLFSWSVEGLPFDLPPLRAALEVGGRLGHFSHFWESLQGSFPFILSMVRGYSPPFVTPPPLTIPGERFSTPSKGILDSFVDEEVRAMLGTEVEKMFLRRIAGIFCSNATHQI